MHERAGKRRRGQSTVHFMWRGRVVTKNPVSSAGEKGQPGDDAPRGRRLGDKKYMPRKTVDFVK